MMSIAESPCPENSIVYNNSQCACSPGYLFNSTTKSCSLFDLSPSQWVIKSGVDYSTVFPDNIFSFDQISKFTRSQTVFLEATVVILLSWLIFCFIVRFGKFGDGRSLLFRIRWWISRLDVCFSTRHWLEDQKVVKKRKTELGGAFSIASFILFIGLFAALLYQIISKRTTEVHNVRATTSLDLISFVNDLEFNITTVSSMSCSQLRGLGTILMGKPGIIGYKETDISTFAKYSCLNTSNGPTINLRCFHCHIGYNNVYISWNFVDILNQPAASVGFQFNLTAKNPGYKEHISFVSGIVKNASFFDDQPITFRGEDTNVLQFNLLPRVYHNKHNLKLLQPLFHEFLPGSFISDAKKFQSSLQNSSAGLINTTLFINFLSDYIVEIDNQHILGPVSFLADLGGLYCISLGIFYYLLVQCEYRIKRLRNEDQMLRSIRSRRRAQDHWEKLRKYVIYTWGCKKLQEKYLYVKDNECCSKSMTNLFRMQSRSLHKKRKQEVDLHSISFDKGDFSPKEKGFKVSKIEPFNANLPSFASTGEDTSRNSDIPHPPTLPGGDANGISDIQKSIQSLYKYNIMLRNKLAAAQSKLDLFTNK
ncbi:hypothetical protein V2J09_007764 [Rumex salicifolius]